MSISIVTVALNAAADLPLTLESVAQQDYYDVELVVVDGGSHDDTERVLERYEDTIDRVVRTEDAGIFHAMNLALDHCRNAFVLFLNARDTLYAHDTLSTLMALKHPDTDVFFGNHVYLDGPHERFQRAADYDLSAERLLRGRIDHRWLSGLPGHQAIFVRTDLLRRLRFDTGIAICADHDLTMRAYRSGARFQYIDQTVSHYAAGGFSSRRPERLRLEWCRLYREHSLKPEAVDAFFLGGTPSPFGAQNALTGRWLTGESARQPAAPEQGIRAPVHWCRPDGCRLLSPARGFARGISIEGFNPFPEQRLALFSGETCLAERALGSGWFTLAIPFPGVLPPGSVVELSLARGDARGPGGTMAGLAVAAFAFDLALDPPERLRLDERLAVTARNAARTRAMLVDGWSHQEEEHVWSVGETARLLLRLPPTARALSIELAGNPFVEDPARRAVAVSLDGRTAGVHPLPASGSVTLDLDTSTLEAGGDLSVVLRPLERARPPGDDRTLGIRLTALACR